MTNFSLVSSLKTDFNGIPVTKYRSSKTGLQVVHVECEGPLVNGFFLLATEALDDDGCPHTLEHLVFLGSEDYPYKGVLDSLANRALARGTNAWTDVDHTCYTLTTAGSQGFLSLLPIFLDHILYPTLTYSGYYTEIHHINEKGEDAGVVYSEMQGRENTQADLMHLAMQRELYRNTGYQSETGGLMYNLRHLKLEKIQDFHKSYYRPDNLCLVITGQVDQSEMLAVLDKFEQKITGKGPLPSIKRPWVESDQPSALKESVTKTVDFPDEEETTGSVMISWHGPKHDEYLEHVKLLVLDDYLTDSVVSLLQREFVEIENAYATSVSFGILRYLQSSIYIDFDGVPKEKLNDILPHFMNVMKKHLEEGLDQERLQLVISKLALKSKGQSETDPSHFFIRPLIYEFLYSPSASKGDECFKLLNYLEKLKSYSLQEWSNTIKNYLFERPYVCVIGNPSNSLMVKLQEDEKKRNEKQAHDLGAEKLKALEKALNEAKAKNEQPIPHDIFDKIPIPSVDKISRFKIETASTFSPSDSSKLSKHINGNRIKPPFFIQFDKIDSEFVEIALYIDTQDLSDTLRPYLELYLDLFFVSPIKYGNTELSHEQLVMSLEQDTVSYENSLGFSSSSNFSVGPFGQFMLVEMKVEKAKYGKALEWLHHLINHSVMTETRINISAMKLLNDIPNQKREGMAMSKKTMESYLFNGEKCNVSVMNILKQEKFLNNMVEELEKGNSALLINNLNELRATLFKTSNMRGHVIGNVYDLSDPLKPWTQFQIDSAGAPKKNIPYSKELLTPLGSNPSKKMFLLKMPAIESCFMTHVAKGPNQFDHPDIAALRILNEYLTTMEGLFWKEVRGTGLAYGASIRLDLEAGLIYFIIYRSPDAYRAFEVVKKIMEDLKSGKIQLEDKFIEAAKSSVTFSIVSLEETASLAASESFLNQVLKQVKADNTQRLLKAVQNVTKSDLQSVLVKYLLPLFDSSTSCGSIALPPSKVDDRFAKLGYEIMSLNLDSSKL